MTKLINSPIKKKILKIIFSALFFISCYSEATASSTLNTIRISYDNQLNKARIVFDSNKKINFQVNNVDKKYLRISLKNMSLIKNFRSPVVDEKYIKSLVFNKGKSSLNFSIKPNGKFKYKYFSLTQNDKYSYRLVIDVYLIKKVKKVKKVKKNIIVIAIDAGHGGKDPGAIGKRGTMEKDIVLSISKKLYALLRKEKNIRPVLIRKNDTYIPLRSRIKKARKFKADLFISIHADAARNRKASGSSIYVLSQHGASSEAAKWLANKENAVDLIGGVSLDDKDNILAQVILDLSLSATIETSIKASSVILSKLKKVSKIHSHNIGQAGFVVLKSPDIPSMLIETSFLSNVREEKKLKTAKFQKDIAKAIRDGILDLIKQGVI